MKSFSLLGAMCTLTLFACEMGPEAPQTKTTQAELIDGCVTFREHAFTCRETIVDDWISIRAKARPALAKALQTKEGRDEIRKVALAEFIADGSGPIEPRAKKCAQVSEHLPPSAMEHIQKMSACGAPQNGCQAWAKCVLPAFEAMVVR